MSTFSGKLQETIAKSPEYKAVVGWLVSRVQMKMRMYSDGTQNQFASDPGHWYQKTALLIPLSKERRTQYTLRDACGLSAAFCYYSNACSSPWVGALEAAEPFFHSALTLPKIDGESLDDWRQKAKARELEPRRLK
jgi:hypothetical protein